MEPDVTDFAPREQAQPASASEAQATPRSRWRTRRQIAALVSFGVAVAAAVSFALTPSPYVIEQPGPVFDTLGSTEVDGDAVPLISIADRVTYPTDGSLDMLTVNLVGNPESRLSWLSVGTAWFRAGATLLPIDAVFPPEQTSTQREAQNKAEFIDSQQEAIAAALGYLGENVVQHVAVADVATGTPAAGILRSGDELVRAAGSPVTSVARLRELIASGNGKPVQIEYQRAGVTASAKITPTKSSDGRWVIGIAAATKFDFPFAVTIQLNNVGGPSAGMMFALGIIDKLTPGALTGGVRWAGTGTIDASGAVGPIGGIRQKMVGARSGGARYMLAPADNCDEVVGHIPAGLDVFRVSTLSDAVKTISTVAHGGDISQLPRCTAG